MTVERRRRRAHGSLSRHGFLWRGALVAVVLGLQGCESGLVRVFEPVDPTVLESRLTLGVSTRADVRAALGEPVGSGRSMLPFESRPRTMWTYWYEEGTTEKFGRTILFVHFDDDAFAGYLWFSSFPETKSPAPPP